MCQPLLDVYCDGTLHIIASIQLSLCYALCGTRQELGWLATGLVNDSGDVLVTTMCYNRWITPFKT